jgi:hypothetical protein
MEEILKKLKGLINEIPEAQRTVRQNQKISAIKAADEIKDLEDIKEALLTVLVDR